MIGMAQIPYLIYVTHNEWHLIEPLLPRPSKPGRSRT